MAALGVYFEQVVPAISCLSGAPAIEQAGCPKYVVRRSTDSVLVRPLVDI
jgi:hypothetical protein